MLRDLKPCIRCKGKGAVPIMVIDPDSPGQSVVGRSKCHGCNGTGRVPKAREKELIEIPEPEGVA